MRFHGFDEAKLAECQEAKCQLRADTCWSQSGAPMRHANTPDSELHGPQWVKRFRELERRLGEGFLVALLGKCGTGKTQLGVELIRTTCAVGRRAMYEKTAFFFMAIQETYGARDSGAAVIARYTAPRLLVLDEVSQRGNTPWEDRTLDLLIDVRYDSEGLDTVLLSNDRRDVFLESVGPRIKDRLIETGGIIECDWPSFRQLHGQSHTAKLLKEKQR